jgi:hypothetical protein
MRYHGGMKSSIPSANHVAARLKPLRTSELQDLALRSGVPYRTLLKIRFGQTVNPGIETVRKFYELLPEQVAVVVESAGV